MLQPIMEVLSTKRIVLASGSPRRRELLSNLNMKFEVVPSGFAEDVVASDYPSPAEFVEELAFQKAMEVATRLDRVAGAPEIVIGADTVVTLNGKVYGKPSSRQDAVDMITRLSGVTHQVFSGVAVLSRAADPGRWSQERFSEVTAVTMDLLPDDVIQRYVDTGEPMDKAGGYGIQGLGGSLVSHIQGDYYNVVGLPVHKLCRLLYRLYSPGANVFAAVKVD